MAQALNVDISSFGDTLDDAKAAIGEALELFLEGAVESPLQMENVHLGEVEVRIG